MNCRINATKKSRTLVQRKICIAIHDRKAMPAKPEEDRVHYMRTGWKDKGEAY